jgi:hypothetical protein
MVKGRNGIPSPLDVEDSKLEERPSGARPDARRTIGRIDQEDSVNLDAPPEVLKGRNKTRSGGVGLRAATDSRDASDKAAQARNEARQKVREGRDERRQRVWDKLDEARRKADERSTRLERFRPKRDHEL